MPRRKKVRTTISLLRRPKKCLRRASHFLEFFRFFRGNMLHLRLISAHLRCQKDAGFLAARKCVCGFVSLQLFSSHLNQSEPHLNHVNRRKTRTPAPNCSSSSTIHARKQAFSVDTPALVRRNGIRRFQGENTKGKTQRQKIETQKIVRQKS